MNTATTAPKYTPEELKAARARSVARMVEEALAKCGAPKGRK